MMKYFSSSATEVSCEDIHPWKVFAICEEQNFKAFSTWQKNLSCMIDNFWFV